MGRPAILPVNEIFGPTLQGEGPAAGRAAQFVRLGGCNLSCTFCDTPYTWDDQRFDLAAENPRITAEEVLAELRPDTLTVITGGEPLMHQHRTGWERLLQGLVFRMGCTVHVETNGTLPPNLTTKTYVSMAVVSPKLGNAGAHRRNQNPALHPAWVELVKSNDGALARNSVLKVVVDDASGVDEAVGYAAGVGWPKDRVWVMPKGTTTDNLQTIWPEVARRAADVGVNASHRLHVLAWGDQRGV
ncbi:MULTISPECIES: 7-carboxy-7-deazaguanine synthase QueE [unclassified Nocardia]|uniref:7-carboxy-7-deazaguanine synthase QueE n=1 Tax=unclassified Nocardia TaxID=2637762 RepID=UPI00278C3B2E|nr:MULTISPECIES: 7-carboxy-7-deazaguanine synthase QueE [unclassified Nocardia]